MARTNKHDLPELVAGKRSVTLSADEMLRVPRLAKSTDVLALDNFMAMPAFWTRIKHVQIEVGVRTSQGVQTSHTPTQNDGYVLECVVVVIFAVELVILLNERFATKGHVAGDTPEVFCVSSFKKKAN